MKVQQVSQTWHTPKASRYLSFCEQLFLPLLIDQLLSIWNIHHGLSVSTSSKAYCRTPIFSTKILTNTHSCFSLLNPLKKKRSLPLILVLATPARPVDPTRNGLCRFVSARAIKRITPLQKYLIDWMTCWISQWAQISLKKGPIAQVSSVRLLLRDVTAELVMAGIRSL